MVKGKGPREAYATRWPTSNPVTPAPSAETVPAASRPISLGSLREHPVDQRAPLAANGAIAELTT